MELDNEKVRDNAGIPEDYFPSRKNIKKILEEAIDEDKIDEEMAVWILEIIDYIDTYVDIIKSQQKIDKDDVQYLEKKFNNHRHDLSKFYSSCPR